MQTVTVPAATPSINAETDSVELNELPPVPPPGIDTKPTEVRTYTDTLPAPEVEVQRVTVDRSEDHPRGAVSILYTVGDEARLETYALPEYGETLDVEATSDTTTSAEVRSQPKDRDVEAEVAPTNPPWWKQLWSDLQHLMVFAFGLAIGYIVARLIP
jgi:hypothetical protein